MECIQSVSAFWTMMLWRGLSRCPIGGAGDSALRVFVAWRLLTFALYSV